MLTWLLTFLLSIPFSQENGNFSLSHNQPCKNISDCPKGFQTCFNDTKKNKEAVCIKNMTQICVGGIPEVPVKSCNRSRDCTNDLLNYEGWCDFETKFCCYANSTSSNLPMCPDRVTPLYGQDKCSGVEKDMVYSGKSEQKGGFCYKGYSCPPKITRPNDLTFGSMTFRTNMDCSADVEVNTKYNFMFCHNDTGNLWVMGQYNVNGDEVIKHWTQCKINTDCGEGLVCVKEDLCRYRCYEDPTTAVNYDWIVAQILAMFLFPLLLLASIIFLTVKYLD